jgi:hypothetical protein
VVADVAPLGQHSLKVRTYVHKGWACARQAQEYIRRACARLTHTQQEVQRAYRQTLIARMALRMPTANDWTREITATILARHGLLDLEPVTGCPRRPAAGKGLLPMTPNGFREDCMALIDQLLTQGFVRPITLAAIAGDGLTTAGSSETITGTVLSGVKTSVPPDAFARYLLPIHILFVDPQGRVAYGVIRDSGTASVHILA